MLEALEANRGRYDYVIFTDSFDTFIFADITEIVRKFRSFNHPMVVSGEKKKKKGVALIFFFPFAINSVVSIPFPFFNNVTLSHFASAGEVNCWPNPSLASEMPASSKDAVYKYPNSGGYMAEFDYLLDLYKNKIAIHHKSDCADDQGELIKVCLCLNKSKSWFFF